MIIGKRIIFGKGTILVGAEHRRIILTEIRPPKEIGSRVRAGEAEEIKSITIEASYDEFDKLIEHLHGLEKQKCKELEFKGCVLDFNEYNKKSISVLIDNIYTAQGILLIALAC